MRTYLKECRREGKIFTRKMIPVILFCLLIAACIGSGFAYIVGMPIWLGVVFSIVALGAIILDFKYPLIP